MYLDSSPVDFDREYLVLNTRISLQIQNALGMRGVTLGELRGRLVPALRDGRVVGRSYDEQKGEMDVAVGVTLFYRAVLLECVLTVTKTNQVAPDGVKRISYLTGFELVSIKQRSYSAKDDYFEEDTEYVE